MVPMSSTPGEQSEFDGVSEDGKQAFIFGVYRDPNYSFLGTGNLRAYAELVNEYGSRYLFFSAVNWCLLTPKDLDGPLSPHQAT